MLNGPLKHQKDPILIAEDDEEDLELAIEAMNMAGLDNPLKVVRDGQQLLDYLSDEHRGVDEDPTIILLDLRMPRMDGFAAMQAIKSNPQLAKIPIVVLSTSDQMADVEETYKLCAQSYIVKPNAFSELVDKFVAMKKYWFETVRLPREE